MNGEFHYVRLRQDAREFFSHFFDEFFSSDTLPSIACFENVGFEDFRISGNLGETVHRRNPSGGVGSKRAANIACRRAVIPRPRVPVTIVRTLPRGDREAADV